MDRILYQQAGEPVAIVVPVRLDQRVDETEREALLRHARQMVPEGVAFAVVAADAIPADRTWRNAWTMDAGQPGAVTVDMTLAREVHRTRLRAARAPLLEGLDADFLRALEAGDDTRKAQVAARKQMLRDAPAAEALVKAATPEALIASIPDDELRERYARIANVAKGEG